MAEKARLRRKDIKQPDEFITRSRQVVGWARQHQQLMTWGGVGVVVLLAALGIATAYRGARVRDANADLSRALIKLSANDYAGASNELLELSARWDGTDVASVAALFGANAAISAGNPDRAITELVRLQGNAAQLEPYLQQQVLVAWGAALERKQQWLEAAAKYKDATALSGPYTADAVLGEARARERGGETERARELYRQAYDQFPDLPDRDLIAAKL